MAVLGYVAYCVLTLWVTLLSIMLVVNPFGGQEHRLEKWVMLIIAGIVWYGAYYFFPFNVSLK